MEDMRAKGTVEGWGRGHQPLPHQSLAHQPLAHQSLAHQPTSPDGRRLTARKIRPPPMVGGVCVGGGMAVCSVDPGDPCESVDGPPVCSVKAIVVQRGNHHEAAAGSILITPLRAQHAMASASAPPLQLLQAVPAQLAYHLEGDPRAQALSHQLSDVDTELGFRFFTEERRSWVMSLPTESGEKVLNALCASGLVVEADLASRLQTLCKQRWYVLARFLAAKTAPVQFCIGSVSGGSGVSADSHMPEKLEAIPSWYEEQWESKVGSSQWVPRTLNEAE